jgi:hypothetical protein
VTQSLSPSFLPSCVPWSPFEWQGLLLDIMRSPDFAPARGPLYKFRGSWPWLLDLSALCSFPLASLIGKRHHARLAISPRRPRRVSCSTRARLRQWARAHASVRSFIRHPGFHRPTLIVLCRMGWNTWNHFGCSISEDTILSAAKAFVKYNLTSYGYECECRNLAEDRRSTHYLCA